MKKNQLEQHLTEMSPSSDNGLGIMSRIGNNKLVRYGALATAAVMLSGCGKSGYNFKVNGVDVQNPEYTIESNTMEGQDNSGIIEYCKENKFVCIGGLLVFGTGIGLGINYLNNQKSSKKTSTATPIVNEDKPKTKPHNPKPDPVVVIPTTPTAPPVTGGDNTGGIDAPTL